MKYSEAKQILEQREKAKAVLDSYQKIARAHEQFGFKTRREFIKALQEVDKTGKGKGGGRGAAGKARGTRGLAPETIDQIKKLKAEGRSNAEIARTTGVSPLTVAKYVKGVAGPKKAAKPRAKSPGRRKKRSRGKRGLSPSKVEQIKKLKGEGKKNAEIGRTVGVSPLTVAKYVKGESSTANPVSVVKTVLAKVTPAKRKPKATKK